MKSVSILIILFLIIGSVPLVSGKAVHEPTQRDVFLYQYFSRVLVRFDHSLRYAIVSDNYSLKLANLTLSELELIKDESLYYQEKGVNSTVMRVIPPFYDFASETVILVQLLLKFHENPTTALASGVLSTIDEMERTLDAIDLIRLKNGTKVLTFNTTKVRTHLEAIRKLVSNTLPEQGGFIIGVSESTPILHQTVTIFGSCPTNSSVTVVIEGNNTTSLIIVNPHNGLFSTNYKFDELGVYKIYAIRGSERSNNITVTVRKIPTTFIVDDSYSAILNHTLHLSGKLVDYYGKPLMGRDITVDNTTLTTGSGGNFSKDYFSPVATRFNVTLRFKGDATHTGTVRIVEVTFIKCPLSITLTGPTEVTLRKTAFFTGTIVPPLPFPITVYVAGKKYLTLTPDNGTFTFELKPNETGEFKVYAAFPGNERYEEAKSNVIVLRVLPAEDTTLRYAVIALLALLMIGSFILLERRKGDGKSPARKRSQLKVASGKERVPGKAEMEMKIPEDIGEAYALLRESLNEALGISESMTPREVLKVLKDWDLYPYLEIVTKLHERAVYGERPLSKEEVIEFREALKSLLRGVST